jgi:hypothetical protein
MAAISVRHLPEESELTPPGPGGPSYIRGGRGADVDSRIIGRVLLGCGIVALDILVAVLSVAALRQNGRLNRLHREGVAVKVTVTGCQGVASGTGTTVSGYSCRGTFTLDGGRYNEVIDGTSAQYHPGATIRAVTVPGDPKLLSAAKSVTGEHSTWHPFITPAIALVLLIGLSAGPLVVRRRRAKFLNGPAGTRRP